MWLHSAKIKLLKFFGLLDSIVRLKIVKVSDPPPKYFPDIERYLYSDAGESIKGVMSWYQVSNTPDHKPVIEVIFRSETVSVDQIVEHLKKEGIFTEPVFVKIRQDK